MKLKATLPVWMIWLSVLVPSASLPLLQSAHQPAKVTHTAADFLLKHDENSLKSSRDTKNRRFSLNNSALRIPFKLADGNHIFLQGRINNSAQLWFALDTGAGINVIDAGRAQALALNFQKSFKIRGAGGKAESSIVTGVSINLAGVDIFDQKFAVTPLDSFLESSSGQEMDGILGYDLLNRFIIEIDYAAKLINLYDPQSYEYRGAGESIPIIVKDNHAYVNAQIVPPGQAPIQGQFVIDTGSGNAIILNRSFVEEHKLREFVKETVLERGEGIGGQVQFLTGRVERLQLGRFVIDHPVTAFPRGIEGEFAAPGAAGNIGSEILSRFRIIFDYSRQRMILEPNEGFYEPHEYDMSGLSLIAQRPTFRIIKVKHILENSPAIEARLRPGDVIIAIDGKPTTQFTLDQIRQMFKQDDREYVLSIKRQKISLQTKIKLRRLI